MPLEPVRRRRILVEEATAGVSGANMLALGGRGYWQGPPKLYGAWRQGHCNEHDIRGAKYRGWTDGMRKK